MPDNKSKSASNNSESSLKISSLLYDTLLLKEAVNQEDKITNEYLIEKLKPIRVNFKRINSITNWTTVKTKHILETTEGGQAEFYYLNGCLEKVIVRHFGEIFQQLTEYYLANGQLSFVLEQLYKYNRPIYQDSTMMKELNDSEVFDFKKSAIVETRSYFDNGKLLHQLNSQDCGSPYSSEYLFEEGKKIKMMFEQLPQPERTK